MASWLLLIHQLPAKPDYLRVKIGRRLARAGAVGIKNSVYALPTNEAAQEDAAWILKEIAAAGGEGFVCEARLIGGLSDEDVTRLFRVARDVDYAPLVREAEALVTGPVATPEERAAMTAEVAKLRRRAGDVRAIDFHTAPLGQALDRALDAAEARVRGPVTATAPRSAFLDAVWVTRSGVQVDRVASAWLIRRFLNSEARFKFVPARGYEPLAGEVRFDMYEAEFTHEGEDCTFEVLRRRLGLESAIPAAMAEIIHDIDVKDGKFGRPETAGVGLVLAAIATEHASDEERITRASAILDDLLGHLGERG